MQVEGTCTCSSAHCCGCVHVCLDFRNQGENEFLDFGYYNYSGPKGKYILVLLILDYGGSIHIGPGGSITKGN